MRISLGLVFFGTLAWAGSTWAQPSFRTARIEEIFGGTTGQVASDLNGDGNLDLFFPAGQASTVAAFFGLGDGTFRPQEDCPAPVQTLALGTGDFDEDGLRDLLAVDAGSVAVLRGTGGPTCPQDAVVSTPGLCEFSGGACEVSADCPPVETCDEGVCAISGKPCGSAGECNRERCVVVLDAPVAVAAEVGGGEGLDVDMDGHLDAVVVNGEELGSVVVLLGSGDGRFRVSEDGELATGALPVAALVGDLDGDGDPDIVAVNRNSNDITVFRNGGSGRFEEGVEYPCGSSPRAAVLADFDEDGVLDVILASRDQNAFTFVRGDGNAGFGAPRSFPAGIQPVGIAAGDFDGDGHLDVALANNLSYDVTVAFGDGSGNFPRRRDFLSDAGTSAVLVGLFDGDDLLDLVAVNVVVQEGSSFAVLRGEGGGRFAAPENLPLGAKPKALAVGELSNDARPDLVVASTDSDLLTVLSPLREGFVRREFRLGRPATSVLLRDLDGDAHPDVVLPAGESLLVAPGDGRGGFGSFRTFATGASLGGGVDAADFDGDGRVDLVATQGTAQRIVVLPGRGGFEFGPPMAVAVRPEGLDEEIFPLGLVARDLDGDGKVDVAVTSFQDTGFVFVLFGRGDLGFETPVALPARRRPFRVLAHDVNRDGRLDLVTGNEDSQGLLVFENLGGRSFAAAVAATGTGSVPAGLALRDLTGDDVLDAILADRTGERIRILPGGRATPPYFNPAVFACPEPNCLVAGRTPVDVVAADFDDDGDYDVAAANDGGSNVTIFTSERGPGTLRGDANGDTRIDAADVVGVARALVSGANGRAVEDAFRSGLVATRGADANGDGTLDANDAVSVGVRIFRG